MFSANFLLIILKSEGRQMMRKLTYIKRSVRDHTNDFINIWHNVFPTVLGNQSKMFPVITFSAKSVVMNITKYNFDHNSCYTCIRGRSLMALWAFTRSSEKRCFWLTSVVRKGIIQLSTFMLEVTVCVYIHNNQSRGKTIITSWRLSGYVNWWNPSRSVQIEKWLMLFLKGWLGHDNMEHSNATNLWIRY